MLFIEIKNKGKDNGRDIAFNFKQTKKQIEYVEQAVRELSRTCI